MSGLTVRPVTEGTPVAGFVTELYTEAFDRRMQVPVSNLFKVSALHKADFGVDSTLGKGSTFWFTLDLVK